MSDIMRPIPFSHLMNWIIEEHKTQGAVFGVRKMVTTNQEGALPIFDERIETPSRHAFPTPSPSPPCMAARRRRSSASRPI